MNVEPIVAMGDNWDWDDARFMPYLILMAFDDDIGDPTARAGAGNVVNRTPRCVRRTKTHLALTVSNLGAMPSDLVVIDHQIVLCTFAAHGPADGFTQIHAGEYEGTTDGTGSLDYVPAGGEKVFMIELPPIPPSVRNLYFRARVSILLRETRIPRTQWNVFEDHRVTEACIRL